MRVLIDTHLLLWALATPSRLPKSTRRLLEEAEVFVSAASIWELGIKSALGKLDADPAQIADAVGEVGFRHLAVTHEHAVRVRQLPPIHRDPFDRLLIAQAMHEPMTLLTNDAALARYGELVRLA